MLNKTQEAGFRPPCTAPSQGLSAAASATARVGRVGLRPGEARLLGLGLLAMLALLLALVSTCQEALLRGERLRADQRAALVAKPVATASLALR